MEEAIGIVIGSNIIALAILLIRKYLGKYLSKRFVYRMWILVPLFMVVFPLVKVPAPKFVENTPVTVRDWAKAAANVQEEVQVSADATVSEQTEMTENTVEETLPITEAENVSEPVESTRNYKINWVDFLVKGYIFVAALVLLGIVYVNLSFILRCREKRVWREKSFGLGLPVYELSDISSPFLFGRSIYVPENLTEEEMRYGTLHEEYHYRHGDSIWVIVRYLMLAIHFYSPIMWAAFKASGHDCELACDEAVMERIHEGERRNYGRCLLHIMENSKYRGAGLMSTNMKSEKSLIKERIKIIASETKSSLGVMMVVVAFMMVVVSFMLLEKTTKVAASIEAANMAQASQEQINAVPDEVPVVATPIPEPEKSDTSETTQPAILHPVRLGQYFSTLDKEPWIVEDANGVLFGYADDLFVEGGPEPVFLGPSFSLDGTASSVLSSHGDYYYDGFYAAFAERTTTWAEGTVGPGIGEYVEIQQYQEAYEENTIDGKLYFDEICIVTGNAKNEKVWKNNNRAKALNFYFEDEFIGVIELEDTMLPQYFDVSAFDLWVLNGEVANFKFEILEVYDGEWYDVTCITGVDLKYRLPE